MIDSSICDIYRLEGMTTSPELKHEKRGNIAKYERHQFDKYVRTI